MRFCSLASKNKKIFFENSFIIISTEHTGSVSHLFCEKDSLPKKITYPGFLVTRAQVLPELILKKSQCYAAAH